MKRSKHLSGWSRAAWRWMGVAVLLLWGSGVVLFLSPADALMDMSAWQHSLRHAAWVVHGVWVWCLCVLCGRGVWPHLRVIWQRRDALAAWWWGVVNLLVLSLVAAAGLLLLYGPGAVHDTVSAAHSWLGLAWPVLLLAHVWRRYLPSSP